jgi:hypothetical protein
MRGPWFTSVFLHGSLFVAINALVWLNVRSIHRQEKSFSEKVAQQEHEEQHRAALTQKQAVREAARDRLAMELADVVTAEGQTPEGEQLLAATDSSLSDLFEDHDQITAEDMEAARLTALDHAEQTAQSMLRQALVAQVRSYIRDTAAPELKERIEHELESQAGAAAAQALGKATSDDAVAHPGADAKGRAVAIADAGKAAVDPALRAAVEGQVRDHAIPELADKVTNAVGAELEKAGIPSSEFKDQVKADINSALTKEMSGQVSTASAWKASEAQAGAKDAAALTQAHDEVSAAASALAQLAERQEQLRQGGDKDQQQALANQAAAAESQARAALTDAKATSASNDHDLDASMENLRNHTASNPAKQAATAETAGDRSAADHAMQDARAALHDDAERMTGVATSLAQAAGTAPMSDAALDASALGADARSALAGKLQAIPGTGAKSVADASGQMQVGGVLGDAASLARLRALAGTVAQARQNAGEGRALGDPTLFGVPGSAGMMVGNGHHHHGSLREGFNRTLYEAFVKDMRNRTHPNNAYQAVDAVTGLDSVATPEKGPFPAAVWALPLPPEPQATAVAPERKVPEPTFKSIAAGAAGMVDQPITIDGDLADWGKLEHPLTMQWHSNDGTHTITGGTQVYMRWSNEGLYFAYTVATPTGLHPTSEQPYSGDCLEVFLDLENQRLETMDKSQYTHQFCFDPFGFKGDKNCTFVEIGRGKRGLTMFQAYADHTGKRGRSAAKLVPGGYSVEAFVAREALSRPVLVPGAYLAFNCSINTDPNTIIGAEQWSASKAIQTWNRPATWGDVLLLGSDASVRVLNSDDTVASQLVPGAVMQVEVTDRDMNIDPNQEDRVMATVTSQDHDPVLMVLKETGVNTGVFKGSLNTASYLEEPVRNTLPVKPGDIVDVQYDDPRAAYGEQHRRVDIRIPVAYPVIRLGTKPQ